MQSYERVSRRKRWAWNLAVIAGGVVILSHFMMPEIESWWFIVHYVASVLLGGFLWEAIRRERVWRL